MPIRVCKTAVTVIRSGDRVTVPANSPFNFTDEEIAQIEAANGDQSFDSTAIASASAVAAVSAEESAEESDGGRVEDDQPARPAPRRRSKAGGEDDDL